MFISIKSFLKGQIAFLQTVDNLEILYFHKQWHVYEVKWRTLFHLTEFYTWLVSTSGNETMHLYSFCIFDTLMLSLVLYWETGKWSQKIAQRFHNVFLPNMARKKFDRGRFWSHAR